MRTANPNVLEENICTHIELCAFENVIAISTKSQWSQGDVMQEEEKKTVAAEPDTAQLESRQPHN